MRPTVREKSVSGKEKFETTANMREDIALQRGRNALGKLSMLRHFYGTA